MVDSEQVFQRVLPAANVPLGYSVPATVNGVSYAIFHTQEGFFAITNSCPHEGAALVGCPLVGASKVRCAAHGWLFELNPAKVRVVADDVERPAVRVNDGFIEIEVV